MLEALLGAQAAGLALCVARIAGFVTVSPFPGAHVSRMQRVGLVFALAMVASIYAPLTSAPKDLGPALILAGIEEVMCGLTIGAAFRMILVAAEFLGETLSEGVGLATASVLNPEVGTQDAAMSMIVSLLAMLVALGAGVHRVAMMYLLQSLRVLPVGVGFALPQTSQVIVDLVVRSIDVGVELAMPVLAVNVIVHVALGMIARAAPALQMFSVGLTVLLVAGLGTVAASLTDIGRGLTDYFRTLAPTLDNLVYALGSNRP